MWAGSRTGGMKQALFTLALVAAATLGAAAAPNHMTNHMASPKPAMMKVAKPAMKSSKKPGMMKSSKPSAMKPRTMATHRP
jgi:hypothetical protein